MARRWTVADIPRQDGRTAIVTGANSGIGLVAARELARAGARVVLACRNAGKGADAVSGITAAVPGATVELAALDLSNLASIRSFAERFMGANNRLDLLVNNAGVMAAPRTLTADGFEMQFGTNHLGHFALTAHLMPLFVEREGARVVNVSSGAHRTSRINFDDLQGERSYGRWSAYGQSKLANLLFTFELDRRLRKSASPVRAMAAHPGYSATNLQFAVVPRYEAMVMSVGNAIFAQSAEMGALPTLFAATQPDVEGGAYIGPDGMFEVRGYPRLVGTSAAALDESAAAKLWEVSEELTGVRFSLGVATVRAAQS